MFSTLTLASTIPDFPFVTVTGESIRHVTPDKVTITFNVSTFNKDAKEAKLILVNTSSEVVKLLKSNGVKEKSIQSFAIDKTVKRKRDENYNYLGVLGYDFFQGFEINLDDLESYPAIADALLEMNNVSQLNADFDYSKREELEVTLIKEAGLQAKQKAIHMAQGLGVEIDSVFAFNEEKSYQDLITVFGLTGETRFGETRRRVVPPSQVIFIPKFIQIFKSIHVVYKLKI